MNTKTRPKEKYCHLKMLTEGESFFQHHVHLDSRDALPSQAVSQLQDVGFIRSHISLNCFSFAQLSSPNSAITEAMFEGSCPETWTIKTDCPQQVRRAFQIARKVMQEHTLQGYLESETVHSDRPICSASKPFDEVYFNEICPLQDGENNDCPSFLDKFGQRRLLPFTTQLRSLNQSQGERAPVMEFHLSINYGMLADQNLACLLHGLGLVSYEVVKICGRADGTPLLDENGSPYIICERPLTIRLASPGRCPESRRRWQKARKEFLGLTRFIRELIGKLGGFQPPLRFAGGELLYPVTFKLESLSGFYFQVDHSGQLPPVYDRILTTDCASPFAPEGSLRDLQSDLERTWNYGYET